MISKVRRSEESDVLVDLVLTDKFNNEFVMTVGGNQDLYWIPKNYKQVKSFYIDKDSDTMFFSDIDMKKLEHQSVNLTTPEQKQIFTNFAKKLYLFL